MSITYDRRLDPEVEQPDGTSCVDRLNTVMLESEIGFEPGGAIIAGDMENAERLRNVSQSEMDKAAQKGVIHPNRASRSVSRYDRALEKARSQS